MCGTDTKTFPALIEGVELNVCQNCSSFGQLIKKQQPLREQRVEKNIRPQREIIQAIREDYSNIIRDKREKLGLKQQEFAKFLSEKESLIHKIESGTYVPSIELARKIERQLGIPLVEEKEVTPQHITSKKETFTIGDVVKVR
jgi:putative transcription factor